MLCDYSQKKYNKIIICLKQTNNVCFILVILVVLVGYVHSTER